MAITDKKNCFGEAVAITASAAFTDSINLGPLASGNAVRNIGPGEDLYLYIVVDTAVQSAGSSTVAFTLETDSTSAFSSVATVYTTGAIAKAALIAGYEVAKVKLPIATYEQHLRLYATVATADLTAGKFSAYLVRDVPAWTSYARVGTDAF